MKEVCRRIWSSVSRAVQTTPIEVVIVLLSAIAVSLAIEDVGLDDGAQLASALATAALVALVSFITSSAHELRVFDARTRWLLNVCFGTAAAAYGVFVFDPVLTTELWRYGFLTVGGLGLVTLAPLAARAGNATASERFWRFNVQMGVRVALAGFYSTMLFAGVCVGLFSVEELFGVQIDGDLVGHLGVWIVGVLGATLAFSGLRDAACIERDFSHESKVLGAQLGTWLFLPLMLLYLAIMYIYLGQVATGVAAPSNVLSPLALGAGALGYFGLFLLHPVRRLDGYRVLNRALDAFPAAFIPLVGLGLWAVGERVEQYGWTEFRYARVAALVCLGAFSVVGAWKWLRRREFSLTSGPSIVATVALLSAVGPWSASHVSYRSQLSRVQERIAEHDLAGPDGLLLPADALRASDGAKIYSEVKYLVEAHGPNAVAKFSSVNLHGLATYDQLRALGVDGVADSRRTRTLQMARDRPVLVPAGRLYALNVNRGGTFELGGLSGRLHGESIVVDADGRQLKANLGALGTVPYRAYASLDSAQVRRDLVDRHGKKHGALLLRYLTLEEVDEAWEPTYVEGFIVLE